MKAQAQARLETLCCLFGLPIPILRFREYGESGWYRYKTKRRGCKVIGTHKQFISVGGRNFMGREHHPMWEPCLLHEFAHYLTHSRADFAPNRTGDHGPAFHRALTDVAEAWYGDAGRYPWQHEYKSLAAAGPRPSVDF